MRSVAAFSREHRKEMDDRFTDASDRRTSAEIGDRPLGSRGAGGRWSWRARAKPQSRWTGSPPLSLLLGEDFGDELARGCVVRPLEPALRRVEPLERLRHRLESRLALRLNRGGADLLPCSLRPDEDHVAGVGLVQPASLKLV